LLRSAETADQFGEHQTSVVAQFGVLGPKAIQRRLPSTPSRWAAPSALASAALSDLTETLGGGAAFGPPKSEAGLRLVPFSDVIAPDMRWHLACFTQDGDDGLVFTSPTGALLRHSNFYRRVWVNAVERAGMTGVHFHDLRHTGNMLTADAGANLRELMDRMGHASTRAAVIYLHSTDERQRRLADAVGKLARAELRKTKQQVGGGASGTKVARRRGTAS